MSNHRSANTMERIVSSVLQVGVITSTLIILAGLISFFMHGSPHSTSYHQYTMPNYTFPHSIPTIKSSAHTGEGSGLIELGILLLILTPLIRVATSVIIFLRQRDKPMTLITLSVLVILACSFVLGIVVQ